MTNRIFYSLQVIQISMFLISDKLNMVILYITGTAHFFFAAYVALFSIVIMNLLIGLAVADIDALMKKAKRENILSQIDMIYDMMEIRATPIYRYCAPECLKTLYER